MYFNTSEGYNLSRIQPGATYHGDTTGNLTGVSPTLGVLSNNGGFTFTHPLLFGSPAMDAGNPVYPEVQSTLVKPPINVG